MVTSIEDKRQSTNVINQRKCGSIQIRKGLDTTYLKEHVQIQNSEY